MVIGIGLQRKGRDMSKLKYLIDGKADEQFENMLWCFGGGDPDSDDSGGRRGRRQRHNGRPGMERRHKAPKRRSGTSQPVKMAGLTP